tara:strand:- start:464 stop:2482 length:2019 start_codon:yes stop_codon:yes gene_type:complete
MIELFVENQKVDVDQSFSTLLTMAIDDIKDFGAKNTTFSKTIIIPGTKNNNVIFGNIFNINAANDYNPAISNSGINFNAAISAQAVIFADNLQVFKGIFRILEIVVIDGFIEFECAVFGELGGFVSALGNNKLEALDMGIANQTYNETTIANSWNSIAGSGVYYPLIDYGQSSTAKVDFDFKTFRPALYVKQYLTKMVEASGYTWEFPLLATSLFDRLIIPNNAQKLYTNNTTAFVAAPTAYNYTSADNVKMTISQTGSFTANGTNDQFTYGGASVVVNIVLYVSGQINTIDPVLNTFTLNFIKNSTIISTASVAVTSTPYAFSLTLDVSNITLNTSDVLYVDAVANVGDYDVTGGLFEIMLQTPGQVEVGYGDTIVLNDTIPKGILQKDFFSSICKMFNLYVFEDYEFNKKLKVQPFVTYYEDATAVDWSLKVDRSAPMRMKPMSELNSRYYQYKYRSDNDYYNDNYRKKFNDDYGNFIYDSEYEFAKDTTAVDIIFASSPLVKLTGTDKIYTAIYKLSNENTKEDKMDSVIRIMQAKKLTVGSWALKNGGTTLASYTAYGYAGHLNDPTNPTFDINMGVPFELYYEPTLYTSANLFNTYWSSYLAEITDKDSRLLTCTMKLNFKDVYQLDFSKLIWIDGVLYRINKIEDFNASNEDVCKVQLLKIINRIY